MAKRKDYSIDAAPKRATISTIPTQDVLLVRMGDSKYDFSPWLSHKTTLKSANREKLVHEMCAALNRIARFATSTTVMTIFRGSLPVWFEYLDHRFDMGGTHVGSKHDIERRVLEDFASWLLYRKTKRTISGRHSYTGARTIYTQVKAIWLELIATGGMNHACIPDNPFPNSNRAIISRTPYTKEEMRHLIGALASDLRFIRSKEFIGEQSDVLIVYLLLLAVRTGRNPSPIFELTRNALQPHPIKPETHALLTTYKRRGNNISVQSFKLKTNEIEDSVSVTASVATLIGEVRELNEHLTHKAPEKIQNSLWLLESGSNAEKGKIICINPTNVHEMIQRFVARHKLVSDGVKDKSSSPPPFQLTITRLRKTFATKIWELTGGDLVRTATALGNQPKITDTHYLDVTPEMIRNHRFVGMCLEFDLRGKTNDAETIAKLANKMSVSSKEAKRILQGEYNTGVGRCSSPVSGKFSPQNGITPCTAFLHCFRCPNQVIMESDLHRLFSFYWLLIKERNLIKRNQWHKFYSWVLREIDQVISPKFPQDVVTHVREEARLNPHPMWQNRLILAETSFSLNNLNEGLNASR